MTRTGFLATTAAGLLTIARPSIAQALDFRMRRLWLQHESGEHVDAYFTLDGHTIYRPGYDRLCWLLRDRHVPWKHGYVAIDIVEIEVLWEVQQSLALQGLHAPIIVSSGYRTWETNASIENAARNSQHCYARAVDMWVPGLTMRELFDACWQRERAGGVGYYEDHIHLDSGARRWWTG